MYMQVQVVSPNKFFSLFPIHMMHGSTSFLKFFLRSIVKYTTEEAHRRGDTIFFLTPRELEAFISLQYGRGLYRKNHPIRFFCNKEYGISVFSKTMPQDRFLKFLKYLRFDDKPNRQRTGRSADRFASIREVFETFSSMRQTKYNCKFSLSMDEQLMPAKSRCPFITFVPNKPDKDGIKFLVLADVETKYVANIILCLGDQRTRRARKNSFGGICDAKAHR